MATGVASPVTIAIMQPYFIPYAGYFRLFAASDLFVIYDCVQFPRRGWVHRNRLVDATGTERWLTLPIAKAPRDTLICDLRFSIDARHIVAQCMRSFPLLTTVREPRPEILETLRDVGGTPVDYIERLLHDVVSHLGLRWEVMRSSSLGLPDSLHGQNRIVEIARRLGATRYVNAPGGRSLYDPLVFEDAGIELRFLDDYRGSSASILSRMLEEDADSLAQEVVTSSVPTT
jgi:hypothetical protein